MVAQIPPITVALRADTTDFVAKMRESRHELIRLRVAAYTPLIVTLMVACGLLIGVAIGHLTA